MFSPGLAAAGRAAAARHLALASPVSGLWSFSVIPRTLPGTWRAPVLSGSSSLPLFGGSLRNPKVPSRHRGCLAGVSPPSLPAPRPLLAVAAPATCFSFCCQSCSSGHRRRGSRPLGPAASAAPRRPVPLDAASPSGLCCSLSSSSCSGAPGLSASSLLFPVRPGGGVVPLASCACCCEFDRFRLFDH